VGQFYSENRFIEPAALDESATKGSEREKKSGIDALSTVFCRCLSIQWENY
jgi:hypothetical protein